MAPSIDRPCALDVHDPQSGSNNGTANPSTPRGPPGKGTSVQILSHRVRHHPF